MNNIAFGQYYHTNSIIHRLDARFKFIFSLTFMILIFVLPFGDFLGLGLLMGFTVIVIFLTKVPLVKFLKSLRHIATLLIFTFLFSALLTNKTGAVIIISQSISVWNVLIVLFIFVAFYLLRKKLKLKLFIFIGLLVLSAVIFHYLVLPLELLKFDLKLYKGGILDGTYMILRVLTLVTFSCVLSLTTKPTDINFALEKLLSPLEKIKIKTSILAMMVSIALRSIPTLFLEVEKILKAQASRGVDFKEGKLKEKITQIVSLIIPMFIISIKRAEGLADAMEARGYIPGAKRTKLAVMKFAFRDYIGFLVWILIITGTILLRVYYAV